MTIKGVKSDINKTLKHLRIDIKNGEVCKGSITIRDELNPEYNEE